MRQGKKLISLLLALCLLLGLLPMPAAWAATEDNPTFEALLARAAARLGLVLTTEFAFCCT